MNKSIISVANESDVGFVLSSTIGIESRVAEIFVPTSIEELKKNFLYYRQKFNEISFYSCGNNWGYGDKLPSVDNSLVIDLSKCNNITFFDSYHGLISLSPGTTYGDLAKFLKDNGDEWIAPVHGGGPQCSVIGNALERGYGITPHADHFGAVTSLKALLNNGEEYFGSLATLGQEKLDKLFKYGIGPYYDGLFSQSGLGIVTEMTIRLAKKPDHVEMFYFNLYDESQIPDVVEAIKICKRDLGGIIGGINLMNKERCLSMVMDYPIEMLKNGQMIPLTEIEKTAKEFLLTPWLIVGMIYGEKKLVKAARKNVLKHFKNINKRSFFYTSSNKKFFSFISKCLSVFSPNLYATITKLDEAFQVLSGTPNSLALKLSYWKNQNKDLVKQSELNPGRDNCGLIWYAPLVEMKPEVVVSYINFIKEASEKFKINPLITLTTVDDLCFDSTIPILFNKDNEADTKNAREYFEYLFHEGAKLGFYPYRLSTETQSKLQIQNPNLKMDAINPRRYQ